MSHPLPSRRARRRARALSLAIVGGLAPLASTAVAPAAADAPLTCHGLTVTIVGTDSSDTLVGTAGPDVIHGGNGDDTITGLGGDDTLCGGEGSDVVDGGPGDDYATGSTRGRAAPDRVIGGPGDDTLVDGEWTILDYRRAAGPVRVDLPGDAVTGEGEDTLVGRFDAVVYGSAFDDRMIAEPYSTLVGMAGSDTLIGSDGPDQLYPDDRQSGGPTSDRADDVVRAGDNPPGTSDVIGLGGGADRVDAGPGNNRVRGEAEGALVVGGEGSDQVNIVGGARVYGGPSVDFIAAGDTGSAYGGEGADALSGRRQFGGPGDDHLRLYAIDGAPAAQSLDGGEGRDVVVLTGTPTPEGQHPALDLTMRADGLDLDRDGTAATITWASVAALEVYLDQEQVTLTGSAGPDLPTTYVSEGRLDAALGGGDDRFEVGAASWRVSGGAGDDVLTASSCCTVVGPGTLLGDGGDDELSGAGAGDLLVGGAGDDRLSGGAGNDRLYGGAGRDALFGERGRDQLFGQVGTDSADGGDGDDVCRAEQRVRCEA